MLSATADVWFRQMVYVPVGYLLAGLLVSLFVPANQLVALLVSRLPGDYEIEIKEK